MEVHFVDPAIGFPGDSGDHIRVLTVPHPVDPKRIITNVICRYRLAGGEISFQKNPFDSEESFDDALNWAKSFARVYGIGDIYAADFARH